MAPDPHKLSDINPGSVPMFSVYERRFSMARTVEIYFDDLTVEAQENLLRIFETTKKDENWDVFPITVIERWVDNKDNRS